MRWAWLFLFFTACNQTVYMREKTTQQTAPPPPAVASDAFLYGQPIGPVDIIVVVDNTETFEVGLPYFQTSFQRLLGRFRTDPARQLDYRILAVSDPGGRMPKSYAAPKMDDSSQMGELFGKNGIFSPSTNLDRRENGYPDPGTAVIAALGHPAFKGRDAVPLFIVFITGHDWDPGASHPMSMPRGSFQTLGFNLVRQGGDAPASLFPYLDNFYEAPELTQFLSSLPWRSFASLDLRDAGWVNWDEQLFNSVLAFKSRMVLSHVPYEPWWSLQVQISSSRLRYGDQYTFDPVGNEIQFTAGNVPLPGDLVGASYYLDPGPPANPSQPLPQGAGK